MKKTWKSYARLANAAILATALLAAWGCSTSTRPAALDARAPAAEVKRNGVRPWEIADDEGVIVLPDVFYADPVQNEQVMPYSVKTLGGIERAQIDQLVYPTLGNPFLYIKRGSEKRFMSVLRLEAAMLEALGLAKAGQASYNTEGLKSHLSFYLVRRDRRSAYTDAIDPVAAQDGIFPVAIEQIVAPSLAGAPVELKRRYTAQVFFTRESMDKIPEGLYDVRMELAGSGAMIAFESQFNAIKIFGSVPRSGAKYRILNITDVQTSLGLQGPGTIPHMQHFRDYVNKHAAEFQDVAFVSFNGDLHNGGSVEHLMADQVAYTYQKEAIANIAVLKDLDFPIFLTSGNHDGYVSTGHAPIKGLFSGDPIVKLVRGLKNSPWEGFTAAAYEKYLKETKNQQGGKHVDVFTGRFIRKQNAQNFKEGWKRVPAESRNMVLYDGQYQWQKSYGPLYTAWSFADNHFVNLNTYELRQHRRTGWGMYTVNYGGGLSNVQLIWFHGELNHATARGKDIVIIGHHDPRGGHNGMDYPFYFPQIDFTGMGESALNYVKGEIIQPKLCQLEPDWLKSDERELACIHDGLQEWMRADPEFDCDESLKLADGRCNQALYAINQTDLDNPQTKKKRHPYFSGYDFLHKIANFDRARTLIFGHTHYHSLEMLRTGQELVEKKVRLDFADNKKYAAMDVSNPIRSESWFDSLKKKIFGKPKDSKTKQLLENAGIFETENKRFILDLQAAGDKFDNKIGPARGGLDREVAIIRLTSAADLTAQHVKGTDKVMFGFSLLQVYPGDNPGYEPSQINGLEFYRNLKNGKPDFAKEGSTLDLDRQTPMSHLVRAPGSDRYSPNPENPIHQRFELKK